MRSKLTSKDIYFTKKQFSKMLKNAEFDTHQTQKNARRHKEEVVYFIGIVGLYAKPGEFEEKKQELLNKIKNLPIPSIYQLEFIVDPDQAEKILLKIKFTFPQIITWRKGTYEVYVEDIHMLKENCIKEGQGKVYLTFDSGEW